MAQVSSAPGSLNRLAAALRCFSIRASFLRVAFLSQGSILINQYWMPAAGEFWTMPMLSATSMTAWFSAGTSAAGNT